MGLKLDRQIVSKKEKLKICWFEGILQCDGFKI